MKINKSILAAMLALGIAGIASADDIYITGSTAMRSTVYTALNTVNVVFTNSVTFAGDFAGGAGHPEKDNYMNFTGTIVGNGATVTTIHCHWSGSEAGVLDACSNSVAQTETFMPASVTGDVTSNTNTLVSGFNVDLGFADNSQSFSRTKSPSLTGTQIGIVTFEWVRNNGLWSAGSSSGLTNITDANIQAVLSGGCRLADFTGNTNDTSFVYAMGRDNLSGTRVNTYGDSGYGIFTAASQIEVDNSGNMIDLTGGGVYKGDYGYSSGGTLAGQMGKNTTGTTDQINGGTGFSVVAYFGISDANTALGNAGTAALTYDGVPFSRNAVLSGQYPFWGYEYVYKGVSITTSGVAAYNRLKLLATQNTGVWAGLFDGVKAIHKADMLAGRGGPTSQPQY